MTHSHTHEMGASALALAFWLSLSFALVELIGGVVTSSLALVTDSWHAVGDTLYVGLAWILDRVSRRKENAHFTFGYKRFSLLGALLISLLLIVGSVRMSVHAIEHLAEATHATEANPLGMLIVAVVGILLKGFAVKRLSKGHSLNEHAVMLHIMVDLFGLLAVVLSGIVMLFTEINELDVILSLLIALWILWNALKTLWNTLYIFIEAVPKEIKQEEVSALITSLDGVEQIESLYLWSLDGEQHLMALSVKVSPQLLSDAGSYEALKAQIRAAVADKSIKVISIEANV